MSELKSNTEWKQWGKDDPLWGVAAARNKQKDGPSPWTAEEFYAVGERDWQVFARQWRQYGMNTTSCLEIGCGAGRFTRLLARSFDHVHAVDVSQEMISIAQKALPDTNVEYSIIDGLHLPLGDRSVKAIFSNLVFQHLDSAEVGFSYFHELFRVLDVGGTIMINLPFYQLPAEKGKLGVLMRSLYAAYRQIDNRRSDARRRAGVKIMRWTPYPIESLHLFLSGLGFKNVEFRIFPVDEDDHGSFVFATK